jgi:hypothetical protein
MTAVRAVVEGATDLPVARALLKTSGLVLGAEPIVTNGKTVLDQRIGKYFQVSPAKLPLEPEASHDAKRQLVEVCRSSKRRDVREGLVPRTGTRAKVGPEYAAFLTEFGSDHWRPAFAAERAPSLAKALAAMKDRVSSGRWR